MSIYNPPLNINSVFNTTDYTTTNSSSVSQSDADSKYLKKLETLFQPPIQQHLIIRLV